MGVWGWNGYEEAICRGWIRALNPSNGDHGDWDWNFHIEPDPAYRALLTNPKGQTNSDGLLSCEVQPRAEISPGWSARDPNVFWSLFPSVDYLNAYVEVGGTRARDRSHSWDGNSIGVDGDGDNGMMEIHPVSYLVKVLDVGPSTRKFIIYAMSDESGTDRLKLPSNGGRVPHTRESRSVAYVAYLAPVADVAAQPHVTISNEENAVDRVTYSVDQVPHDVTLWWALTVRIETGTAVEGKGWYFAGYEATWQLNPGRVGVRTQWSGWNYLSNQGDKAIEVAAAAHPDGRVHAIMIGLDNQLWHNEQIGAGVGARWTGWSSLSPRGEKAGRITVVAHADGRLHAIAAGIDNQLSHNEQIGFGVGAEWSGWHDLSNPGDKGTEIGMVAAVQDGRLHAVMVGLDSQVWHNWQTALGVGAAWSGWNFLSKQGDMALTVSVVANTLEGRVQACMAGVDNEVWYNEQTAGAPDAPWTGWQHLMDPTNKATHVAVVVHPNDGRDHSVMVGLDSQLWHNEQAGDFSSWLGWSHLSNAGDMAVAVAVAAHSDGRMHAIMAGRDNQVWHNEQTDIGAAAEWTGWNYLTAQGDKAVRLALVADPDARLHAIMVGLDNQLWHNEQVPG